MSVPVAARLPGVDDAFGAATGAPPFVQPSLSQLWAILRFHQRLSLRIALGLGVLSVVVLYFWPKTYEGVATLMVDAAKKNPLAAQSLQEYAVQSYIQTQIELIQSPVVLDRVVDKLGLTRDRKYASGYRGDDAAGLREYTAANLAKDVSVDLGKGGQLLFVRVRSGNAARAAEIANTVADVYIDAEEQRFSQPNTERAVRYSKDLVELRRKVNVAEANLATFRSKNQLADVTAGAGIDVDVETRKLNELNDRLMAAQNQRRQLESRRVGEVAAADEALASPIVNGLKTELSTLRAELARLSAVYGPQHPKVLELNAKIATTNQQYRSELQLLSGNTATGLARARALEGQVAEAVKAQNERVLALRDQQGEGARLTIELQAAQAVYKRALDGYDQIMFAAYGRADNVSVVQRALVPFKSTSPNKLKWLAACLLASMLAGILMPLLRELLTRSRRVHSRDDIERSLGVPVLARLGAVPAGSPGD